MGPTTDQTLHDVLVSLVTIAAMGGAIAWLVGQLAPTRPGFAVATPVAIAFGIRVVAAGVISLSSFARALRGGDEVGFLAHANLISHTPVGSSQWGEALVRELHVFNLAAQRYLLDSPELAMRVTQVGIAVAGLVLLAAAVYELAGPRASVVAMWILALEPTNIFFSSLLHKEADMTLAAGLVAFGGSLIWKRGRLTALLPIALGCLVAVGTRPYAGWFLIAAAAAIVLHAGLRQRREGSLRSLGLIALVVMLVSVSAPIVLRASTSEGLQLLQSSQNANASNQEANLSLERVDFSTRGAILANLPRRTFEILTEPFPWQVQNLNQQVGLIGTMVAYLILILLLSELIRSFGSIMGRTAPLIYVGIFMLFAYSLAAGNAGTAFRYRSHLVVIAICVIVTLWRLRRQESGRSRYAVGRGSLLDAKPTHALAISRKAT